VSGDGENVEAQALETASMTPTLTYRVRRSRRQPEIKTIGQSQ
jgi:hypothetical protein